MLEKMNFKIYLNYYGDGVVQADGTIGTQNLNDFYINFPLKREIKLYDEYVDVQFDPLRLDMQRQLINPWFIEFGFFDGITSTGITGETSNNYNTLVPSNRNLIKKAKVYSITINK